MTTLFCPAKINLFLAIGPKDASGFHQLETVLMRVESLQDILHIEPAKKLEFTSAGSPEDESNLVLRAIRLLEQKTGKNFHYKIHLEKHIPLAAGLGGGSSNAASTLLFLNEAEKLGFTQKDLMELGAQLGMDIPFFISKYPMALGTHYGEKITPLPPAPKDLTFTIHEGPKRSTAEAYAAWEASGKRSQANSEALVKAIYEQNTQGILEHVHNDFQTIFPPDVPDEFGVLLSGSGGAYAVFHGSDTKSTKRKKSAQKTPQHKRGRGSNQTQHYSQK
jgi:4-diphosphocytidyl-2-C-methyl-D-erythritol kinase